MATFLTPMRGVSFSPPIAALVVHKVTLKEDLLLEDQTTVGDTERVYKPGGMARYSGVLYGWLATDGNGAWLKSGEEHISGTLTIATDSGHNVTGVAYLMTKQMVYNFGSKGTKTIPFACPFEYESVDISTS